MDQRLRDALKATQGRSRGSGTPVRAEASWLGSAGRSGREVFLAVVRGIATDRIFLIAAGVTFYGILALFPGIGVIVSIYGLFADPATIAGHLNSLPGVWPGDALDLIRDQLTRFTQQDKTTLGLGFAISLLIALWSSNAGVSGLFGALNAVYEEPEKRNFLQFYATTLAFTVCGILLVILSIFVSVALPFILDHIPAANAARTFLNAISWPMLFVLSALALAVIYRCGPCRSAPRWPSIIGSSVFAAAGLLAASALFSWYVANFGSYSRTYGSLGAIFGFMTWMWISAVVILVGGKIDAELEQRADAKTVGTES
jgi:membrane protein